MTCMMWKKLINAGFIISLILNIIVFYIRSKQTKDGGLIREKMQQDNTKETSQAQEWDNELSWHAA